MESGFIKVNRKFFRSNFWRDQRKFSKPEAWLDLIQRAAWHESKVMVRREELTLEPGQLLVSISKLAEAWQWSKQAVTAFFKQLEEWNKIERQVVRGVTVLTLRDYEDKDSKPEKLIRALRPDPWYDKDGNYIGPDAVQSAHS